MFQYNISELFRGDARCFGTGDMVLPMEEHDPRKEQGSFVYASENYALAAAYGMKSMCLGIDGYSMSSLALEVVGDEVVPFIVFGHSDPRAPDMLLGGRTCVQVFDAVGFVPDWCDKNGIRLASEWKTSQPVVVQKSSTFSNSKTLEFGAQLFTGDYATLFSSLQEGRRLQSVRQLFADGVLCWENLRPEYDGKPQARSHALASFLGVDLFSPIPPQFHPKRRMNQFFTVCASVR